MSANIALYQAKLADRPEEWVEGFYVCLGNQYHYILTGKLDITGLTSAVQFEHNRVVPKTIREAIKGAFDKNHRQIFTKDIVRKGFELYCIDWDAEQLCYSFYTADGVAISGFNVPTLPFVEVVGNTIDNPDMLMKGLSL